MDSWQYRQCIHQRVRRIEPLNYLRSGMWGRTRVHSEKTRALKKNDENHSRALRRKPSPKHGNQAAQKRKTEIFARPEISKNKRTFPQKHFLGWIKTTIRQTSFIITILTPIFAPQAFRPSLLGFYQEVQEKVIFCWVRRKILDRCSRPISAP